MGVLFRLLAPRPVKRARRTVRKAAHPVRTARRAATPKPIKKVERQVRNVRHPASWAELKTEDAVVKALRGKPKRTTRKRTTRPQVVPKPTAALQDVPAGSFRIRGEQQSAAAWRQQAATRRKAAQARQRTSQREQRQARVQNRQRLRTATKAARGPRRWPEFITVASIPALVLSIILVALAGDNSGSPLVAAGALLLLAAFFGFLVSAPVAAFRWNKARRTAAVAAVPTTTPPDANQPRDST